MQLQSLTAFAARCKLYRAAITTQPNHRIISLLLVVVVMQGAERGDCPTKTDEIKIGAAQ